MLVLFKSLFFVLSKLLLALIYRRTIVTRYFRTLIENSCLRVRFEMPVCSTNCHSSKCRLSKCRIISFEFILSHCSSWSCLYILRFLSKSILYCFFPKNEIQSSCLVSRPHPPSSAKAMLTSFLHSFLINRFSSRVNVIKVLMRSFFVRKCFSYINILILGFIHSLLWAWNFHNSS